MTFKKLIASLYLVSTMVFLLYLALPSPEYPDPLPSSLQSKEPADEETPLRRGYFTDLSREEIMSYYQQEFQLPYATFLPNYRLNYPPEESQTLIRDQNRSIFLEEIVYPFRESFFVSGYKAKEDKDRIVVENKEWVHKVTVRLYPSSVLSRLGIGIVTSLVFWWLLTEWGVTAKSLGKLPKKI